MYHKLYHQSRNKSYLIIIINWSVEIEKKWSFSILINRNRTLFPVKGMENPHIN